MKGIELRAIRTKLGLSKTELAYMLGYTGNKNTMYVLMTRYEHGQKAIPLYLARYVWTISLHFDLTGAVPSFPDWPGYHLDEE